MFLTESFIKDFTRKAQGIKIDGIPVTNLEYKPLLALFAYYYNLYQTARKYMPSDSIGKE